ncbi:MAG: IS110 family transposase [Chloroflexi bacterium]|nr:IS110 family transposase [Chloroflexota bacterium]
MRATSTSRADWDQLPVIHAHAAGSDIGSAEIWVAAPPPDDPQPVRQFDTYTPDLHALADWLAQCQITTVAMESTGVYWIPLFEVLEARGFQVAVVNARHLQHVTGRKSDWQDCQWIQRLHTFGLLNDSFHPAAAIRVLRTYLRQRAMLLEQRAAHIQHMQKALQQMNVQLTQVLSDITGKSGLAILRAIVAGERNPQVLAQLREERCEKSASEIAQALTGNYRTEHLFSLQQALTLYDCYTEQVRVCDGEIEKQFQILKPERDAPLPPLARNDKRDSHSKNAPAYDARGLLYELVGVDLVAISGLNALTVQTMLSEVGTDMRKFPSEKHFCSWLSLAPHNDISGGKVLRSRVPKTNQRAGQAFRRTAQSLSRKQDGFGEYYRRQRARLGPQQTIVATAHKLARVFYHMLKEHTAFKPLTQEEYARQVRVREIANLKKKAARLGFTLAEASA